MSLAAYVGFTITRRDHDYVPAMDGFRPGSPQTAVFLHRIPVCGTFTDEALLEGAYVATNAPQEVIDANPVARAWQMAYYSLPVDARLAFRPLCVGDTITLVDGGGIRAYAIDRSGFIRLESAPAVV